MKNFLAVLFTCFALSANAQYYEMRVYYPEAGKMADLQARFRNHTMKLFEKHGMKNIGYFVPKKNQDSCLTYFLEYPSRAKRDSSWKAFGADPEWTKVKTASELNGKLVKKVETKFLKPTDYSPFTFDSKGGVLELRTYQASKYNLGLLNARFRNHTVALFEKHGMINNIYWTEEGKDDMLIYFVSHKTIEAGKASFASFVADPAWVEARAASEKLAKGSITAKILSEYYIPTDFSPWK